ncbi:MAG TPA: chemotaxis protein CheW [Mycobacteriales bacterium]|nr:chemotaxis protein CheW [Mycobacteriales bacterium]
MSHVVVRLGGGRFALPMDMVAEVGRMPGLTRVPGTPGWVAGVANWRGRILGVLDLRVLLGVGDLSRRGDGTNRLVVLTRAPVSVGLIAERVEGVLVVDPDQLEPPLLTLPADAGALLEGQVTDAEGPVGVIDAGAVLSLRHRVGAVRRTG